eukprot:10641101-Lingulodinium_polyedra.AAC.1
MPINEPRATASASDPSRGANANAPALDLVMLAPRRHCVALRTRRTRRRQIFQGHRTTVPRVLLRP